MKNQFYFYYDEVKNLKNQRPDSVRIYNGFLQALDANLKKIKMYFISSYLLILVHTVYIMMRIISDGFILICKVAHLSNGYVFLFLKSKWSIRID
jgi:hypothetical protein